MYLHHSFYANIYSTAKTFNRRNANVCVCVCEFEWIWLRKKKSVQFLIAWFWSDTDFRRIFHFICQNSIGSTQQNTYTPINAVMPSTPDTTSNLNVSLNTTKNLSPDEIIDEFTDNLYVKQKIFLYVYNVNVKFNAMVDSIQVEILRNR